MLFKKGTDLRQTALLGITVENTGIISKHNIRHIGVTRHKYIQLRDFLGALHWYKLNVNVIGITEIFLNHLGHKVIGNGVLLRTFTTVEDLYL